ncbi:MAG: murein biosynthesis integral membrane protein MurJ [Planctomycetaceae bacterium]
MTLPHDDPSPSQIPDHTQCRDVSDPSPAEAVAPSDSVDTTTSVTGIAAVIDVNPPHHSRRLAGFRLVSLATIASRVLGMVRDTAMASAFGAGPLMDAFSIAFRFPNLARSLFGEGAQSAAFLPTFIRSQEQEGEQSAKRLATAVSLSLGMLLAALVLVCELVLGCVWWMPLSVDNRLLVELLMLLTPYLMFVCVAAQQSTVMQGLGRFFWPSMSPLLLNTIWLLAIPLTLYSHRTTGFAGDVTRMKWVCVAILIAGVVQVVLPWWVLRRWGYGFVPDWRSALPKVRHVFASMVPLMLGVLITQFNTLLDGVIAWGLSPGIEVPAVDATTSSYTGTEATSPLLGWFPELSNGTAAALYYAQRMSQFPLGVFGVALGTVLLPRFSRHAERNDFIALRSDLTAGLGLSLSIGLPASVGLMLVAFPATSLLFERGAFTAENAALTSEMTIAYSSAVWSIIGLMVVNRAFYAVHDRMTPMRMSLCGVAVNCVLNLALLPVLHEISLAWATSVAAMVQFLLSLWRLQQVVGRPDWSGLISTLGKTLIATSAMGLACWFVRIETLTAIIGQSPVEAGSLWGKLIAVVLPLGVGGLTYLGIAHLLGLREPWRIIRRGSL